MESMTSSRYALSKETLAMYLSNLCTYLPEVPQHFFQLLEGHKVRDAYTSPLPYTYITEDDLPDNFNWGNVNGKSYLTHSLNQHIPVSY